MVQDYPADRYEVVVADDGSTDATRRVVQASRPESGLPRLRYLPLHHWGPNAARNYGIAVADGDPVCVIDDDVSLPTGWLTAMVQGVIDHPAADCFGGPIRLQLETSPPRMCGAEPLGESELDLGPDVVVVTEVWSANMAIRRRAFSRAGMFREDLVQGGTESEWEYRLRAAGGTILYIPAAEVQHRRTAAQLRLRRLISGRFWRGRGQALNAEKSGRPYDAAKLRRALVRALAHGCRHRCAMGFITAAHHAGRLLGMAESRVPAGLARRSRSESSGLRQR